MTTLNTPLKVETTFRYLTWLLFSLLAILIAMTFKDYGISTDEAIRNSYGKAVLEFYLSKFTDTQAQNMGAASYYGGFFDTLCAVINMNSPFGEFETRHLISATIGWYGILGAYRLSLFMSGHVAGFFTALFLVITPAYYGHLFINPKDLPFASFYVWTLYYGIHCINEMPKTSFINIAKLGIHLGLLLAIKVVGGIISIYLLIGLLLIIAQQKHKLNWSILCLASLKIVLPTFLIAYLIMLAFWPWAWLSPFTNPFIAALEFSSFSAWTGTVIVFAQSFPHNDIPFYYLPAYFLVKLPEIFLLTLVMAGLIFYQRFIPRNYQHSFNTVNWIVLGLGAFLPIILAIALKSTIYSGLRHFLFTIPIMAVFAGYSFEIIFSWVFTLRTPYPAILLGNLLGIYLLKHISIMMMLHPYQYTYFNQLTGGTVGAFQKFEIEYWSTSYKEAVKNLQNYLNTQTSQKKKYKVFVPTSSLSASHYFNKNMILTQKKQHADFIISNNELTSFNKKLLFIISRLDTPYSYVIKNNIIDLKNIRP